MKKKILPLLALFTLLPFAAAQTSAPAPAAPVSATPPAVSTGTPDPQKIDASAPIPKTGNARFFELHEKFLARRQAGPIDVLFLGDSITEGWNKAPHIWEHYYGKLAAANFGIGGDQTQHVIWRITNGELDGITPKVVVLMIGTNNSAAHTGDEIAAANKKIIAMIHEKIPATKVLLLAIYPRDARRNPAGFITDAAVADAGKRMAAIDRANTLLAKLDNGANVRFLDINSVFLGRDGKIPWTIMPDQLHPNAAGYQLVAEAIQPLLTEMLK